MCRRCHQNHFFARCVWHINVLLIGVTDNLPRFVVWDRNRLVTGMLRHRTKLVALMANITLGLTSHPSFVFYPSSPGKKSFCTVDTTVTSRRHQQLTPWWHLESENEEIKMHPSPAIIQDDSALEGRRGSLSGSRQCLAP